MARPWNRREAEVAWAEGRVHGLGASAGVLGGIHCLVFRRRETLPRNRCTCNTQSMGTYLALSNRKVANVSSMIRALTSELGIIAAEGQR